MRVGVDQAYGGWNAPVDPATGEFAYVPIPEGPQRRGMETPYATIAPVVARFAGMVLPAGLAHRAMHLDPDFEHLTYGDNGERRGRGFAEFGRGDFVAFYAGLRPIVRWEQKLMYALIGLYMVRECVRVSSVPRTRWAENAHTRRVDHHASDVIVRAQPGRSGRLRRCISIGEYRDRAYRVRRDILDAWGGLSVNDGYIQRSAVPPMFTEPARFLTWLHEQKPRLVARNNP